MSNKERMLERLKKRKERLDVFYTRCVRQVEAGEIEGETERIWLDQFAKGNCLDLCCGDYLIEGAIGIDFDERKIGASFFFINGANLEGVKEDSIDSIVTNYLDVFSSPLAVLQAWHRTLKLGATLAVVCRNSDAYPATGLGPLENSRRACLYNDKILQFFLRKAKFEPFLVEKIEKSLCIASKKI